MSLSNNESVRQKESGANHSRMPAVVWRIGVLVIAGAAAAYALTGLGEKQKGAGEPAAAGKASLDGKAEKRDLSFDQLLSAVRKRFGESVKEWKELGPRKVIFLTDVHVDNVRDANTRKIAEIEKLFDLQLLGLEGFIDGPGGKPDKEVDEYSDKVLAVPEKDVLKPPKQRNIEGALPLPDRPERGSYRQFFESGDFQTIGLEEKERAKICALGSTAEEIIDILLDVSTQGYIVVSFQGQTDRMILQYLRIQEALKDDPLFPRMDLGKLKTLNVGGRQAVMFGKEDIQWIGEIAVKFKHWLNERGNFPRNAFAAERMEQMMQKTGATRAAIIFGRHHARRAEGGPTIQDELGKKNISYIVIDPN